MDISRRSVNTLIATSGLASGDVLTERVAPYTAPSEAALNKASLAQTSLGPVEQVPSSVASLAKEIVGAESNPIAQVRALQQRLRTSYYSDGTQSPSQPGHGAARIASMTLGSGSSALSLEDSLIARSSRTPGTYAGSESRSGRIMRGGSLGWSAKSGPAR